MYKFENIIKCGMKFTLSFLNFVSEKVTKTMFITSDFKCSDGIKTYWKISRNI